VVSNVAGRKLTWEEIGRRSVRQFYINIYLQNLTIAGQSNWLYRFGRP